MAGNLGTMPDGTATVKIVGDPATDNAARAALATDHLLSIADDHFLVSALGATELVNDVGGGRSSVDVLTNDWLLLHGLIISTELQAARASWCLRSAFSSGMWMDLQSAGGLPKKKYENEAAVAAAIVTAAKAMPPKEVRAADTLSYNITTGTWLDEALTGDFVGKRAGGGALLAQARALIGDIFNAADAAKAKPLLEQMPYTLERVVGDIQGLSKLAQAKMIGTALLRSAAPQELAYIPPEEDRMVELFRRADPNGLLPLIERGWQVAFTNILTLLTTQASVDDAVNFITTAHAVLGHGDVLKIHGCRAVDSAAAPIAVELAAPSTTRRPSPSARATRSSRCEHASAQGVATYLGVVP